MTIIEKTPAEELAHLRMIAEQNNSTLVTEEWLGDSKKHQFKLADGRIFGISPRHLRSRGWPGEYDVTLRRLAAKAKKLEEIRQIAITNNGRLLSTEWIGNRGKLRFITENGLEFSATPHQLKSGWPKKPGRCSPHSRFEDIIQVIRPHNNATVENLPNHANYAMKQMRQAQEDASVKDTTLRAMAFVRSMIDSKQFA